MQREHRRRAVVLDQHDVGLLADLEAAELVVHAEGLGAAAGGPLDDLVGVQVAVGDGLAVGVGLVVLAGPVGAQRRAHRRERVGALPHAGVHGQADRDVVGTHRPAGGVALPAGLLALGRDRHRPAGGRDPLVGVGAERRGVHVDRLGRREPVLVHEPDAVVVGRAPDAGVGGDRDAELAGHLERGLLGEGRVAGDVEGHLEAEHVAAVDAAGDEVAELLGGRPLPRPGLDVAVGEDEPARHLLEGVDGGVGVLGGLQPVRPVDGRGHTGVERLDRREQVAGVDVLRAERLAVLEVVPDEVLREGPVGAVAAHRGLPHVPVGVDHARHDDAAGGVDLGGALGHRQVRARPPRSSRRR